MSCLSSVSDYSFVTGGNHQSLSEASVKQILARVGQRAPDGTLNLAWSNREVDAGNRKYLQAAPNEPIEWTSPVEVPDDAEVQCGLENIEVATRRLVKRFPEYLRTNEVVRFEAKVGVDVVLDAHVDPNNGLYKGKRGKVVSLQSSESGGESLPMVQFDGVDEPVLVGPFSFEEPIRNVNGYLPIQPLNVSVEIVPLRLGRWSTLTKSIGAEYDNVKLHLNSEALWAPLGFIGFSRVRSFGGLHLENGFKIGCIKLARECLAYQHGLEQRMGDLNVVRLRAPRSTLAFDVCEALYGDIDNPDAAFNPEDDAHSFVEQAQKATLKVRWCLGVCGAAAVAL